MDTMLAPAVSDGPPRGQRPVGIWLLCVAAMIVAMVAVGGLTRLTGSGLSMTQWHPVSGVIPPLTHQAWEQEFTLYKQIPQYRLENRGMTLSQFKGIFWWEWTHRLLGRLIGVVFAVPFLWFAWRGRIGRKDIPRMVVLFALGGLQGFIGWWMVRSGLEVRVSVSQYRLAIHLGTAIILLGVILWMALGYLRQRKTVPEKPPSSWQAKFALVFVGLVYVQMLLGALVAGLHAGLIYNTWPSMNGQVFPEGAFFQHPWWINFFANPGLAQFDHRIGAYTVGICAFILWWGVRKAKPGGLVRRSSNAVLFVTLFQVLLGIATLLAQAPVNLSATHQLTAALLFCTAVWNAFEINRGQALARA